MSYYHELKLEKEAEAFQDENAKLRKVVEGFYYPRQTLAELDKEGEK